jgi:2,3-dihydroxyphenylpropionate 1,2-dioxygenase
MATIVGGVAASHSTLMNTDFDRVRDVASAVGFKQALSTARDYLVGLAPDAIICIGSNHFRGFFLDLLPTFSIGVGDVTGTGESGTPKGRLETDPTLARHLLEGLVQRDIDAAFSIDMTIDHGLTHAVQYLWPSASVPIIPIVINLFAPPLPSVQRCAQLGQALASAVRDFPANCRVAVVASGGLSHTLPWPDWRAPESDDDRFLVEAWLRGRHGTAQYEDARRKIIRAAPSRINPEFDRRFLRALEQGGDPAVLAKEFQGLDAEAGNGGAEIRNWIAAKNFVGAAPAETVGYWAIEEWITGMGVALLPA